MLFVTEFIVFGYRNPGPVQEKPVILSETSEKTADIFRPKTICSWKICIVDVVRTCPVQKRNVRQTLSKQLAFCSQPVYMLWRSRENFEEV